ncbi:Tat pathway signal protein [Streptomyces sp. bgisy154]|uniref:Tat pathway signal protein n=1 Tax=Streptomyces sp. bgisy154 TaxID=3413794 RepID=UPI003D761AC9
MARRLRRRNTQLEAVLREAGWSQEKLAAHFRIVAAEIGALECRTVTRSHVSQWIAGSRPKDPAPRILCETLSRRLRRIVTLDEVGLLTDGAEQTAPAWEADTLTALARLGDGDMDMNRRQALYSMAGAALPSDTWWAEKLDRAQQRPALSKRLVTADDVESVREMMTFFSRRDQRYGGRAGRPTLVTYLRTDVADLLLRRFPAEDVRRSLFAAASELVYLAGWMAFDASQHATAQPNFSLAVTLAAEAGDAPLAGHILRAMAHQALDLGHGDLALSYASASLSDRRYGQASPREKALLGVIHARSLATTGQKADARTALMRAENDLRRAEPGDDEPGRVWFFTEAALAHETARTLTVLGDLKAAEAEFQRSVRTRKAQPFARTHSVTLGYLGNVQIRQGQVDAACASWTDALDAMQGVQSGRARDTVIQMRRALSPVIRRGGRTAAELDQQARAVLSRVG